MMRRDFVLGSLTMAAGAATQEHRGWVGFATSGNPGWPQYDLTRRQTMHFDVTSAVVDDPLARERAIWEGVR